jgi:phosphoglucomutase
MRYYCPMKNLSIATIATTPFQDQRPGTSGLRKKTSHFLQPHYVENFAQSIFDAIGENGASDFSKETLIIGGDGRFYNKTAIQIITKIAIANGFGRILVGRGGLLSTPAMSAVIRRQSAIGGILLTASHNPGGPDADFGIKYNIRNGGPAPESVTENIFSKTRSIGRFLIMNCPDIDIDHESVQTIGDSEIEIIDPLKDYEEVLKGLFDFAAIQRLFQNRFRLIFDAMYGVTGPYAQHIFEELLTAPAGTVMRATPLEDFGGLHPDPNQLHAAELVQRMFSSDAPDMGAACDGDGDRNMILGRDLFISPGDSLAVIAEHAQQCIPGYAAGLAGVARSMPTSTAVDRVAKKLNIPCYETPTGWKYFGNLMDSGQCTLCGEESFGTGSNHIREKDGIWAVLAWLSILAEKRSSISQIVGNHWQRFGRSYFQRHDYEGLEATEAGQILEELRSSIQSLTGTTIASTVVIQADDFCYSDPVDGSVSAKQGIRIILGDGSRIVGRLSGTGTEGATLRLYFERYQKRRDEALEKVLQPLVEAARNIFHIDRFHRDQPSVIT